METSEFLEEWRDFWSGIDADIRITLGIEPVEIDEGHVVMRMPFKSEISQATGLFSAGALIQLADVAATWLALVTVRRSGANGRAFPLAVQVNSNLVGNSDRGEAIARAEIVSAGKTVIVTRTEVQGEDGRLFLAQTGTHIVRTSSR